MNRLILILFLAFSSFSGFSQFDWLGSQDNDWYNGANWNTGIPPGSSTDHVTIQPSASELANYYVNCDLWESDSYE